ncbi:MAG: AMP-binding protein [Chitinispirillales bacterium]|jgi:long-chain acyl-CoA synthetase|nr:AMP-binding protein [Chitinispirillales bacterium]
MKITSQIIRNAQTTPDKPAILSGAESYSYDDLKRNIHLIASEIEKLELTPEAPIAICMPNCAEFVFCLCASEITGHCALLLNSKFRNNELTYHINSANTGYLFALAGSEIDFTSYGFTVIKQAANIAIWEKANISAAAEYYPGDYICQITSGTIGNAKGAIRTVDAVKGEIEDVLNSAGITNEDVFLVTSPVCHSFGLVPGTLAPLYTGATVFFYTDYIPANIIKNIVKHNVTALVAVPFLYQIILDSKVKIDSSHSLRLCLTAGAPTPANTIQKFKDFCGAYITQIYGTTETGAMCLNNNPGEHILSVGKPLGDRQFKISQIENQKGVLATKSKNDASRYLYPQVLNSQFKEGWLSLGDIASIDDEGYVYVHGRQSNFINVAGMKVDPVEVEKALMELDGVKETVVIGEPSELYGETVKAFIVTKENLDKKLIINHCRERIADYKVPKKIEFINEIPKSETGKILYRYLRGEQQWN